MAEKHKKYTGISNDTIKKNFLKLDKLDVPFLVRTPIIPGVNDSIEEITEIRDFIKGFKNIIGYELLHYHPLGMAKQKALGTKEIRFKVPTKEKMEELRKYADLYR